MFDQYLNKDSLLSVVPVYDFDVSDLISADSYNETKILERFQLYDKKSQGLLIKCAIHIAVIGSGNRTFGKIRDGKDVLDISDIFTNLKIPYNKGMNEKYDPDTLSPRRLVRLLRFHIQEFITKSKRPSYLWTKYAPKDMPFDQCFPGAEHLVTDPIQAGQLLTVYGNIDTRLNTRFTERLTRVFIARGIWNKELDDVYRSGKSKPK